MSIVNNETLKNLLNDVACSLREENAREIGNFNIFDVIGIGTNEVLMCRFLTKLLDPSGIHGQERLYLNLFFERVLDIDKPCHDEEVTVHKEWELDNNRRIDIVIKDDTRFIPIEVKINAGEQENQCADYMKYAKNSQLYYLTIDGHFPSSYSIGTVSNDKIKPVSWRKEILSWLDACIKSTTGEQNANLHIILEQFTQAIKNFCEEEGIIVDVIQSSPDYVQAALEIAKCIPRLKANKIAEISKILNAPPNNLLQPNTNDTHKEYLTYTIDESAPLFLRIQYVGNSIEACLLTGAIKNGKWVFGDCEEYIQNYAKLKTDRGNGWWLCKEVIVYDSDFHLLFDKENIHRYIDKIIKFYDNCKLWSRKQ